MKKPNNRLILMLLSCTALSACGGGGGGGGGGFSNNAGPVTSIAYTTPTQQATVDPFAGGNENSSFVGDTFMADLDGDGASDDMVIAGRETMPFDGNTNSNRLSVHSFENGQMVDKTSQWFSGTDNVIIGTEPDVKFADFFNTGKQDMFVSHSTDRESYGPATFFKNNGSNFTKVSIPTANIWSHGSDVGDLNNDGFKDIFMLDYGHNSTVALNNQVNGFTALVDTRGQHGDMKFGGSGAAIGNFMNNGGNNEIIVTDAQCPANGNGMSCSASAKTKMYSVDFSGGGADYTWVADLPESANSSNVQHNVRVVNHDYNEDGSADVIVFSRSSTWNRELSEIQFLQNDGSGGFTDTTSSTLVGYKTDTASTYKPKFFDINGDGKTDILVSGQEFSDNGGGYDSHQFLLKTTDNKYVAAYQNVLKGFLGDVASISGNTVDGSTVNIFEGDDGNKYLVTWASLGSGSVDNRITVFMSRLDGTTIAAGTAVNMIQNAWSYLSDAQAAQALSDTGQSFMGGTIIDIDKAFQPIGTLHMNGLALNGHISGFDIGNISGQALDGIGRNYTVNLTPTNVDADGATMYNSIASFNTRTADGVTIGVDNQSQQFTVGYNMWSDADETGNGTTYSMHMSSLNSNPWIGFSGVWGEVQNSNIIDSVLTYKQGGFTAKGSVMHVRTNFEQGLITEVSDQFGAWGEISYTSNGFDVGAGVHPVMLKGDVTANIPTSVDMRGKLNYTEHTFKLPTHVNGYLKANYNFNLDENAKIRVSSAVSQSGDQNASVNYSLSF